MAISETSAPLSRSALFEYDVAVVGLGHAGLPTALAYYASGRTVLGVDTSADRLISIGTGFADLVESDRERLEQALMDDRFQMTVDLRTIATARSVIICVPAPVDDYYAPDVATLKDACAAAVQQAVPGQLFMLTTTAYVGCAEELLVRPLRARGLEVGTDVFVAFSAERIEPGSNAIDQEAVPRVVGGATLPCRRRALDTLNGYAKSVQEVPTLAVAEMAKLLEHTFRAVNLALATELAGICRSMSPDVAANPPGSAA
jgi:UDP-N-acetyl-D-glucosamine dehydrogenase